MQSIDFYSDALFKLIGYIEKAGFTGYDPYDLLASQYALTKLGAKTTFLLTQLHKRNPINIRCFLGIKRNYVPKGMGLFLKAYSMLYKSSGKISHLNRMEQIFNWLIENSSKGFSGPCWGLLFPFSNRLNFLPAMSPSIVVTSFVHDGIHEYYKATGNENAKKVLRGACEFVLKDLNRSESSAGMCFSYTTTKRDRVLNANALAAQMLARTYSFTGENELAAIAKSVIDFTCHHIDEDGHWPFRLYDDDGIMIQTDFHQGFIIDSIKEYMDFTGDTDERYTEVLKKGVSYYYSNQFLSDGRAIWRVPTQWPVDIHNQAQGIITFCNLASISPDFLPFAERIAFWTLNNMFDKGGYFYYRVSRFYRNKISYIRWAQAWMLKALVTLIAALRSK